MKRALLTVWNGFYRRPVLLIIAGIAILLWLTGCGSRTESAKKVDEIKQMRQALRGDVTVPLQRVVTDASGVQTVVTEGVKFGVDLVLVGHEESVSQEQAKSETRIQAPELAVLASLAARVAGLPQIGPPAPPAGGLTAERITGALALAGAAVVAWNKSRESAFHKADADEGWRRALPPEPMRATGTLTHSGTVTTSSNPPTGV